MLRDIDYKFIRLAYDEAKAGYDEGGCPIGSVLASGNNLSPKVAISEFRKVTQLLTVKWIVYEMLDDNIHIAA